MSEKDERLNQLNKKISRLETVLYNLDDNKTRWVSQLEESKLERDILCKKIPLEEYYLQNLEFSVVYHQVLRMEDDTESKSVFIVSNKIEIDNKNASQKLYSLYCGYRTEIALFFSENIPCTKEEFFSVVQKITDRLGELNTVIKDEN